MSGLRPAWVEIDLDALASNGRVIRNITGPDCFLFDVIKGSGYGIGTVRAAKVLAAIGADGIALGDPDDVAPIRAAGIDLPILLYATTLPEQAAEVAALGVIPTIHDMASLQAFAALDQAMEVYVKLDCGVGRIGFLPSEFVAAFRSLAAAPQLRLTGVYSHFRTPGDPAAIDEQASLFAAGVAAAEWAGHHGFRTMVSGSRLLVWRKPCGRAFPLPRAAEHSSGAAGSPGHLPGRRIARRAQSGRQTCRHYRWRALSASATRSGDITSIREPNHSSLTNRQMLAPQRLPGERWLRPTSADTNGSSVMGYDRAPISVERPRSRLPSMQ